MRKKNQDLMKIGWLIKRIQDKFETFVAIALEMAMKTECVQSFLWERIIEAIATGRITNPSTYTRQFYDIIWPQNW